MKADTLNPAELRAAGYKALAAVLGPRGMARFLLQSSSMVTAITLANAANGSATLPSALPPPASAPAKRAADFIRRWRGASAHAVFGYLGALDMMSGGAAPKARQPASPGTSHGLPSDRPSPGREGRVNERKRFCRPSRGLPPVRRNPGLTSGAVIPWLSGPQR